MDSSSRPVVNLSRIWASQIIFVHYCFWLETRTIYKALKTSVVKNCWKTTNHPKRLCFLVFVCLYFSQYDALSLTQNEPNFNIKRLLGRLESSNQYDNSVLSPYLTKQINKPISNTMKRKISANFISNSTVQEESNPEIKSSHPFMLLCWITKSKWSVLVCKWTGKIIELENYWKTQVLLR